MRNKITFVVFALQFIVGFATFAFANEPTPWGIDFQASASPVMDRLYDFHQLLLYIISGIVIFVFLLLAIIIIKFRASKNPKPSKTSHNSLLEIIWTAVPLIVLIVIAIPSFRLLYFMDRTETPELTLKVTGYQWYWGYEFPEHDISFDSIMVPEDEISGDQKRLLSVDSPVYLPVDTNIQILVTAADVLHSFAVPSFGIKTDAVPKRTNETWVNITKEGRYFGQCSEICGVGHAYMPIEIIAVSKEEFQKWIEQQKEALNTNYNIATRE